jgi:hypothetical protein
VLLLAAPGTSVRVLLQTLTLAFERPTPPPFTFALDNPAHGLTAGLATEARRVADRHQGRLEATWPTAARRRPNNFCCVTTRRRIRWRGCWLRQRFGTLPARTFRVGVLRFDRGIEPALSLALRCLPAAQQLPALGVLAVTLVPASRLVSAAAALAQTEPGPRSSRLGLAVIMTTAHGRKATPKG